jgi:Protein of unknown function (DUF2911)
MQFMPKVLSVLAALSCVAAVPAQMRVMGGPAERAAAWMVFFGKGPSGRQEMGGIAVQYGQPKWKAAYDADFDKFEQTVKGKINRLGKDWWTTFASNFDLEVGGTHIPAGTYYLGVSCDQDGKFSLAFLDATKAMKDGNMPFGPQKWQPDHLAPVEFKKDVASEDVEKMTMALDKDAKDPSKATFTISWGKHQLVTDIHVLFGGAGSDGDKKENGK